MGEVRTLSREQARRVYDRIGTWQDTQAFYEDRAVDLLVEQGAFARARRVFEFGCGTGRLAARLLAHHLPPDATYEGVDSSPTMVALASARLRAFAGRAHVTLTDGAPPAAPAGSCDRFVSCYVLDLLSEQDIAAVLAAAHHMLEPRGLLCACGLGPGSGPVSRLVARAWTQVHAWRPALVGGCRPLDLLAQLPAGRWRLRHHARVSAFGVPSEVVVAEAARDRVSAGGT